VEVPPETCRPVSRQHTMCNIAPCWIYTTYTVCYSIIIAMPHGPMKFKFIWATYLFFLSCQILLQPSTRRITPFRLSVTACPQPACMSTDTCVVHKRSRPSVLPAQCVSCGTVRKAVTCRRFVVSRVCVCVCVGGGGFLLAVTE
jgi:hypothetical protein